MKHPSIEQFSQAMEFKGLAPCPQDSRWEIPTDSDICTEVETLQLLFGFVRALRPKVVVETGCNVGCASKVICEALEANGGDGFLYTCDVEPSFTSATWERCKPTGGPWRIDVWQDSGLELVQRFAADADLYWIDSSDSSRMEELRWLKEHGKKGAVVLTHDTNLIAHVADVHKTLPQWVCLPGPRGVGVAVL